MLFEDDKNQIANNIEQPLLEDDLIEIPISPRQSFSQQMDEEYSALRQQQKSLETQLERLSTPTKIDKLSAIVKASHVTLSISIFSGLVGLIDLKSDYNETAKYAFFISVAAFIVSASLCSTAGRYSFYNPNRLGDHADHLRLELEEVNEKIAAYRR
ncbi:MAG: hypothetical protein SFW66_03335 [Gammaproteobacteria bacterium]|nr:hypothetical protein [Gammaproteobacteria bacterium]